MKSGQNKASFAESGIKKLKRKIYVAMRASLTDVWPPLLEQVTANLNNTPLINLGGLVPAQIQSNLDDVKVDRARAAAVGAAAEKPVSYKNWAANQVFVCIF